MQYKLLTVSALAAVAVAEDYSSIVSVLKTALPSSLEAIAATNPAEASSIIAAEFASGSTPSWFTALPTDVQTFLDPALATETASSTKSSSASSAAAASTSTAKVVASTGLPPPKTGLSTTLTASKSTSTASNSGTASATSTISNKNAAAAPTAAFGMVAGAVGVIGLLAL